jgi:hypothetical protein
MSARRFEWLDADSLRRAGHAPANRVQDPPAESVAPPAVGFAVPGLAFGAHPEPLRRRTGDPSDPLGGLDAPPAVADVLRRRRGKGDLLPESTRQSMSDSFGVDLSPVRIHHDAEAHRVADAVQSVAFTHGRDIYFSRGKYDPASAAGQHLLAHELAHATSGESGASGPLTVGRAHDPAETAAEATADRVTSQLRRSYRRPPARSADAPVVARLSATSRLGHGRPGAPAAGTVRRMAVLGTDWSAAKKARHSSAGSLGVVIVRDKGVPLAVKAGEEFLDEAAVASTLLTAASEGDQDGWSGSAPQARPVGKAESKVIEKRLREILPKDQLKSTRTQELLTNLAENKGVMVYGFAGGMELKEALSQKPQGKKNASGVWQVSAGSLIDQLTAQPGMMRMFGRASAADILLLNRDRFLTKVNFDNVMVDVKNKSLSFIDNVEAGAGASLKDIVDTKGARTTGEDGFKQWAASGDVTRMAAGKFADIAARSVPNFAEAIERTQKKAGQTAPAPKLPVAGETAEQAAGRNRANAAAKKAWQDKQKVKRAKDKAKFDAMSQKDKDKKAAKDAVSQGPMLKATLAAREPAMTTWFAEGLATGTAAVLKALSDPVKVTATVSPDDREKVATNIVARRNFLLGATADQAWTAAVAEVRKLFPGPDRPLLPRPQYRPGSATARTARSRAGAVGRAQQPADYSASGNPA